MPIEILAIVTPLGIALIVLLVRYSGLSKQAKILDAASAISRFGLDYPAEPISGAVIISSDQRVAILQMKDSDKLGLLEVFGDRFITRLLSATDIAEIDQSPTHTITVKFNDFTHPSATFSFTSFEDADQVVEMFKQLEKVHA